VSTSFFISKPDGLFDQLLDVDTLVKADPEYYGPRLDGIADLRAVDDGSLHRGNEFRRVASFVNVPLFNAMCLFDPEFMADKKRFYSFLRRNRQYATYQIRSQPLGNPLMHTFSDGKPLA
jgi:hypothetical protein